MVNIDATDGGESISEHVARTRHPWGECEECGGPKEAAGPGQGDVGLHHSPPRLAPDGPEPATHPPASLAPPAPCWLCEGAKYVHSRGEGYKPCRCTALATDGRCLGWDRRACPKCQRPEAPLPGDVSWSLRHLLRTLDVEERDGPEAVGGICGYEDEGGDLPCATSPGTHLLHIEMALLALHDRAVQAERAAALPALQQLQRPEAPLSEGATTLTGKRAIADLEWYTYRLCEDKPDTYEVEQTRDGFETKLSASIRVVLHRLQRSERERDEARAEAEKLREALVEERAIRLFGEELWSEDARRKGFPAGLSGAFRVLPIARVEALRQKARAALAPKGAEGGGQA